MTSAHSKSQPSEKNATPKNFKMNQVSIRMLFLGKIIKLVDGWLTPVIYGAEQWKSANFLASPGLDKLKQIPANRHK